MQHSPVSSQCLYQVEVCSGVETTQTVEAVVEAAIAVSAAPTAVVAAAAAARILYSAGDTLHPARH